MLGDGRTRRATDVGGLLPVGQTMPRQSHRQQRCQQETQVGHRLLGMAITSASAARNALRRRLRGKCKIVEIIVKKTHPEVVSRVGFGRKSAAFDFSKVTATMAEYTNSDSV